MGKAKQEVKPRTCRVCEETFSMSAPQIKAHAKACKGKKEAQRG